MKNVPASKILLVVVLSTMLFFSGFGLSTLLMHNQAEKAQALQEDVKTEILGLEVQQDLLLKNPCNFVSLNAMSDSLGEVERKITVLNERSGINTVTELKKIQAILQIKHWQLVQLSREECNSTYVPVLYFYSNEFCSDCNTQGHVLSYVKQTNSDVMIYAFDSDMDFSVIATLKRLFEIRSPVEEPIIIIGNQTLYGLKDSGTLISLINQENSFDNSTVA